MRARTLAFLPTRALPLLLGLLLMIGADTVAPAVYSGAVHSDGWRLDASPFECRMVSAVPFYGNAVFQHIAGIEMTEFLLESKAGRFGSGQALMTAVAPVWKPEIGTASHGSIALETGENPIRLGDESTEWMLAQLHGGREIQIAQDSGGNAQLSVTNIGFRAAYNAYLDCVAELLPANFEQIKRTAVYFEAGEREELPEDELKKLDNILLYAQADPYLKELYIDGHTDSVGTREDNLKISQQRAQLVVDYLLKLGLPKDRLVIRWHGERYPVANNDKPEGRKQNRRVTIRLERVVPVTMPTLASSVRSNGTPEGGGDKPQR